MKFEGTEGRRRCGFIWYETEGRAFVNTNELLTSITYNFLYIYATSRSLRANPLSQSWFSADFIYNIHRHLPVTGLHYCIINVI
jgi:hypothetical protein